MTTAGTTDPLTAKDPAKAMRRLRGSSSGLLVMLILQFAIGSAVSIYITPHEGGFGEAFSNGALLAIHAVLGILLLVAAIDLLVRAILTGYRPTTVLSAIGLLAIIGAAINGVVFLKHQHDSASLGMALATAVAMLCYAAVLRFLPSSPVRS
jgi:O-antigen/teichoic acid export membrane protein